MNMRSALWIMLLLCAVSGIHALWQGGGDSLRADDPRLRTGEKGVVMLTAEWCGYCHRQQKEFDAAGVDYRVLDIDTEEGERAYRTLGARGVPLTVVGQQVIQGYDTATLKRSLTPLGYQIY